MRKDLSKMWEVSVLCHHPEWVQPHVSHTGHSGCHGVGACRVSVPHSPPGRRDEDADCPYTVVAKHCPDTPCRNLQPPPCQASPSMGPSAPKGSITHQPTHSSAANRQRRSQVSSSHEKKAAQHISGVEGCGQNPEQACCEKTSPLGTGVACTPHVHRHWGLCR